MRKHTEFTPLSLLSPSHVTAGDLLAAANHAGVDEACLFLQERMEQKDGGLAGIYFAGAGYDELEFWHRYHLLAGYVEVELREAVDNWREAVRMIGRALEACLSKDPREHGFEELHTGGGCMALSLREDLQDGWQLEMLITDTGGSEIPSEEEFKVGDFDLGLYLRDPVEEVDQLFICYGKDLALYRALFAGELAPVVHPLGQCPACGGDASDGSEVEIDDGFAMQQCICSQCGTSWTDTYELKSSIIDED